MALSNVSPQSTFLDQINRVNQLVAISNQLTTSNLTQFTSTSNTIGITANVGLGGLVTVMVNTATSLSDTASANLATAYTTNTLNQLIVNTSIKVNAAFAQANVVNSSYDSSNSSYSVANTAYSTANAAFTVANSAYSLANSGSNTAIAAFSVANVAYPNANSAYNTANAAFGVANTATTTANTVDLKTVAAFSTANSATSTANTVDLKTVAAFSTANSATSTANTVDLKTVAAFGIANTATSTANTVDLKTVAAFSTANSATSTANTVDLKTVAAFGKANTIYSFANTIFGVTNAAFDQANTATSTANTVDLKTVAAFGVANTATSTANTVDIKTVAAFSRANTVTTTANTVDIKTVAAFSAANSAQTAAASVSTKGGAAYDTANAAFGYANTQTATIFGVTNAAFGVANTATTTANTVDLKTVAAFSTANNALPNTGGTFTANVKALSLLDGSNTSSSQLIIHGLQSGGGQAPAILFRRANNLNGWAPANNDILGQIYTQANTGAVWGNGINAGVIRWRIGNITDAANNMYITKIEFITASQNTDTQVFGIANGLYSTTKTDQGLDTINTGGYYENGTNLHSIYSTIANTGLAWAVANNAFGVANNALPNTGGTFTANVSQIHLIDGSNTTCAQIVLYGTQSGAGAAPTIVFRRANNLNGWALANNDMIGELYYQANIGTTWAFPQGAPVAIHRVRQYNIINAANNLVNTKFEFVTIGQGTLNQVLTIDQGIYTPGLSDQGLGTIAAGGFYEGSSNLHSIYATIANTGLAWAVANNAQTAPTPNIQTFGGAGSGGDGIFTWVKPTDIRYSTVMIELWSPGGSGGNGAGWIGTGGGGGGYGKWIIPISNADAVMNVFIGKGGAAPTTANTNGNSGSNSYFGNTQTYIVSGGQAGIYIGPGPTWTGLSTIVANANVVIGGSMGTTAGFGSGMVWPSNTANYGNDQFSWMFERPDPYGGGFGGVSMVSAYYFGTGHPGVYGGGGGAAGGITAGGGSQYAGAGGANNTRGSWPAGGGGGSRNGALPGSGANGKAIITVY